MTASQVAALETHQVVALSATQVAGLSAAGIAGLVTSQAAVLGTAQLAILSTLQMAAFETEDLAVLSTSQIAAFSNAQVAALTTAQTMAFDITSTRYATPLVLDLDGNGVSTLSVNAGVQFDIHATGRAGATGWAAPGDGLLALDRNGNGSIDDGGELFGSSTLLADGRRAADGYAALQAIDSNGDRQVDQHDALYRQLRVWVDANSDGISQAGELKTLEQLGIASISTAATAVARKDNGNLVGLESTWTGTDGKVHAAADVWFVARRDDGLASRTSAMADALGAWRAQDAAATTPLAQSSTALAAALAAWDGRSATPPQLAFTALDVRPHQLDVTGWLAAPPK
jgi:hypothetical protein